MNANTSYFCICARVKGWNRVLGFILLAVTWFLSIWIAAEAMRLGAGSLLIALELVLLGFALAWRKLAQAQFARVDWQALRPMQMRRSAIA